MPKVIFLKKDVTGLLPDNFIQDENLVTVAGSNRLVIPEYGAFYEKDFELRDATTNKLISKDDYYFSDLYQEAVQQSGKAVWNIAIIKSSLINTNLKISYRAFGGPFSRNARLLVEWVKDKEKDFINPATWSEVEDIPKKFAPSFHYHLLRDIFGGEYFEEGLKRIENSILIGNSEIIKTITNDVIEKLKTARESALQLSSVIVGTSTNNILKTIDKKFLGLDLINNLDIATKDEMERAASIAVSETAFRVDKYINKGRLKIFSDLVKNAIVSSKDTNLGLARGVIGQPSKANIIASVNGATIVLDSKDTNKTKNVAIDSMVYPNNYPTSDQFTIIRVANNPKDKGGIWLGFNTEKLEAYIGIMNGDECFRKMRWYKFYTDGNLTEIAQRIKDHIGDTKNPHDLTKEQIELGDVENYPVVTEAQILAQESVKSYLTMDTLQYFMAAHLLNLKANPNEDGEVDLKSDLFDKANIIYTPCDKAPAPVCPPKDQLIKDYCVGTEKMGRWTDGACGFYDKIMESNSDDCDYFDTPKQGEEISTFCEGYNLMAKVADGRGGTIDSIKEEKSNKCGWNPLPLGTLISTRCVEFNTISKYADGLNGNYEVTTSVNDPKCGYVPLGTEGSIITEFCNGPNRITRHADGKGGSFEVISVINDPACGYVPISYAPPGPPTPEGDKKGLSISSLTSLANIGDKERITVTLRNVEPYRSYTIYLKSFATINKPATQLLMSQEMVTDGNGNSEFIHEYSVTGDIFNISGATSNLDQLVVETVATGAGLIDSNIVSKQIRRPTPPPVTAAPPPATIPPPPPPVKAFNVYWANGDNGQSPTGVVELYVIKVSNYSRISLDVIVPRGFGLNGTYPYSTASGNSGGVYIQHHLEVLDSNNNLLATTLFGRSITTGAGTNWIRANLVSINGGVFNSLNFGMEYKVRVKCIRESDNVVAYSEIHPCKYFTRDTSSEQTG